MESESGVLIGELKIYYISKVVQFALCLGPSLCPREEVGAVDMVAAVGTPSLQVGSSWPIRVLW